MTSKISKRAAGAAAHTSTAASDRNRRRARAGLLASTALVAASLAASGAFAQTTVVASPGDPAPGQTAIAGGTTLQLNNTSGSVNWLDGYIFTGSGTLETNTSGGSSSFALRSQMSMSVGGVLNVNTGTFAGSSDGQGNWANNLGSLNINAGATFDGVEGAIFIDALTGSGRLAGGFAGSRTTTIGVANGSGTFNGIITDSAVGSVQPTWILALTHVGTGTQTLTGVNTYTGTTTITGGTIALSGSGSIAQSGSLSIGSAGTFDISGLSGGTTVNSLQGAGSVILGANTLTATGASSTFSGSITGSGGFTHTGANTLTLTGTNNWTGVTTISQGVLAGTATSISGSSIVVNASGFGLTYNDVVAGTVTQNISGTGTVNVASSAALTFTGDITTGGRLLLNNFNSNVTLAGTRSGGTDYAVMATGAFTVADTGQVLGGAYIGVSGSNTVTVNNFGLVSTTGTSGTGVGLGSAMRFTNQSVVNNGSITDAVASITGIENGVYTETTASSTVRNYGSITGTNASGVRAAGTGALNLTNYAGGTITGGTAGVFSSGALTLVNTGTISGVYGVDSDAGAVTLTNAVGGVISGTTAAIRLSSSSLATLNLNLGSTVTGQILSDDTGARTLIVAGLLDGAYNAAGGSGVDTITLASTGSITGAVTLGAGDDVFNWQGGTIRSTINAGTGTNDVFNSALGAGVSGSLNLSNLSNFDSYNHQSGDLTLTGSRATGPGWNLVPGSSLTLDGSLNVTTGSGYGITMNGNGSPATVSILSGATLNAFVGVWFNTGGAHTFNNAGTLTASNTGLITNGALTATNTGTLTAGTDGAFSTGFGVSTMTNSGILTGGSNATTGFGVLAQYAGVTVTNNAGTISGGAGGILSGSLQGATNYGGLLSVTNAAGAQISGAVAITTGGSSRLTLNNSGRILGGANGAVIAAGSGSPVSITNNAGGQIVASGGYAVSSATAATIVNAGLIGTGSVDGGGVYTFGGNRSAISLISGTVTNSGTIRGAASGVLATGALTLTNTATGVISGDVSGLDTSQDGINASGLVTILNAGQITHTGFGALTLTGGGTLTNATGGLLQGGTDATFGSALNVGSGSVVFNNFGSANSATGQGVVGIGGAVTVNLHAGSTTGRITTAGANDILSIYSGRGTAGLATTDAGSGIVLQNAGTLGAAVFGTADLGGGTNTLQLRGTGDGTAANGTAGTYNLSGGSVIGASILNKLDTGTWILTGNGAGITTINAGTGTPAGTLIFDGSGLTAGIYVNGATIFANSTTAFGTGTLHMIDPTAEFGVAGTYANDISLEVVNGQQSTDPTILRNVSGGTITLSGRIYETAGVGGANQYVTFDGAGTTILSNTANVWGGVTRINSGTTLSGAYNTISGGSITNNGVLIYTGGAGTVAQNITGTGAFTRNGTGALLLSGTNNWTGVTTITAGELRGATGSISGASIVNNGILTYSNATAGTASQNISGSGAINIEGTGVTLAGAITTTGQLTISGAGSSLILGGSRSGANNTGVILNATSGSLTVANGASLLAGQYNGVRVISANASVTNFGLLQNAGTGGDGTVGAGVYVLNGGLGGTTTVNNGSISDTGAGSTIQGRNAGVRHESGSTDRLVVNNYGLIVGDLYNGVENTAGGLTVNNFTGGYITATLGNGVSSNSVSAVSVTNAGVIGRNIAGNVTVNGYGVVTNGVLTLVNQSGGLITGTTGGVQSNAFGSLITNQAGGSIIGNYGIVNAGGLINNSGLVRGFNDAIILGGATTLTNNFGGLIVGSGNEGIFVSANGSTINNGGLIVNSLSGIGANFSVAITNTGVIASGTATDAATTSGQINRNTGAAIALGAGGSVTNFFGGEILGGVGVMFNNGASGTLTNTGLIDGSVGYGVQMTGAGTITNQAAGIIGGATGSLQLSGTGTININLQGGSTANGQILSTGSGTRNLTVAGSLTGAYNAASGTGVDTVTLGWTGSMTSALLGGGNDSFVFQGGTVSGAMDGGTGTDSFVSTLGGPAVATLSLTSITGFETFAHNFGQLTLTGTGGFANGATVNGGTLTVDGTLSADTLVNSGATLGGTGTINGALTIANGGILTGAQGSDLAIGSLNLSSGSIINATFSGAGGPALFAIGGNLTLDGVLNVASTGAYGFGVYGLMTYGGVLTDNGLTLGTTPGGAQRVSVQTSVAGQINVVHAPTTLLFWDGGNAGQHDNGSVNGGTGVWTAAGSEWTDANGLFNGAMEPQPGFAIFQGTGGVITVDDVAGAVGVTGMQFAADGYSIQGDAITLAATTTTIRVGNGTLAGTGWTTTIGSELTGTGQLAQTDLGTLILTGDNTYTGGTSIDTGRLQVGAGGTTGSILGAVTLANGGTLTFARSDNHVFNNAVSGTGSVNINGVVTLTGPITNTFGVNVGAGSIATLSNVSLTSGNAVIMSGANATVNVANGGVVQSLNGTGIFVTAANGFIDNLGTISGTSSAVFASGDLTLTNGASGSINGQFAISAAQNLYLTNNGSIEATVTAFNNSGIYAGGTGTILNTGSITSGTNAIYTQGTGSVTNSGLIRGGGAASTIRLFGANSIVTNQAGGEINTTGTGTGVTLDGSGGTVINAGTIRGGNAVNFVGAGGTLTNSGGLTGISGSGVVGNGGVVTNLAAGSITGQLSGVTFVTAAGSVNNAGSIVGTTAHGVNLNAGGVVDNSGSISGDLAGVRSLAGLNLTSSGSISGGGNAVESVGAFNDTLTFLTGSTTTGSVLTDDGDDLISLAGGLTGSVGAGAGADTVTLFDTGSFSGVLDGGDGIDAFVLDGGGMGTVDIGTVVNFESRTMQGAGVFVLTGADTSSAGWAINAGVLAASGGLAIGDDVTVTIGANGTLALLSDEAIGSLMGAGAVDLGANTLGVVNGGAWDGVIGGSGGLTLIGGTLTLSGANTYTGLTNVLGGTLAFGASDVLSDLTGVNVATGAILDLGAFNDTVGILALSGTLNGTGTLTAGEYQLIGATVNANLGAGNLFQVSGVSTLNGTSASQAVSITGGTLSLGAADRLSDTATVVVASGADLNLNAFNDTVGLLGLSGTLNGTGTLTAGEYQLNSATVNANLGAGNLFQVSGVSTLNGTSASEAVAITGGTLSLGAADRLSDTATLLVGADGTLNIGAFDETVGIAGLSGTLDGTGTLTAGEYQLNGATVNANLGAGNLFQVSGVSTLNGASASEAVAITGGTLSLGAADRLSDTATVVVASGADLNLNAFNDTIGLLGLSGTLNGAGTLTAGEYQLNGATVNANLGAGNLFQVSGASTLNGASASEAVTIAGGTLSLGAADRLSDTATLLVGADGTLNIGGFNETVGIAGLSGTLDGTGTLTAGEYQLNGATVNANLGAGNLFQVSGVSTLNGTSASEAVTVAGGALNLGAADRLSDTATVVVGSGAVLNLNAFNDTVGLFGLAGTLNGTGTLTAGQYQLNGATVNANLGAGDLIQVSGVSTLNGTSGSQFVSIAGGTLSLGASNRLSDTATVVVGSGATLNLNAFNDTIGLFGLSGTLNGTGTITATETQLSGATVNGNLAGARLFNLAGESILNGTAAQNLVSVQAGALRLGASERLSDTATVSVSSGATLAVGAWQERIGSLYGVGDVTIGSTGRLTLGGAESAFGGRLSGAGTLAHAGGLFTLLGDHTIANIVNQSGELRFIGSTTGAVSVTGGTMTGAGTIGGALRVSNGAVLSPGLADQLNGIGGFTVGGLNLTGGRLNIDVTGAAAGSMIDQIRVLGTATLTGGTVAPLFQGPVSGFDFSTRYLFLQANQLVGAFSNGAAFTAAAQDGLFWRVRYDLAPNSAVLELRRLTDFNPGQGGTENQGAVGSAFSIGQLEASDDYAAVLSILAGLSVAERNAAFDSVSGEALADMTTSLFSANDHFMQTVQSSGGRGDDRSGSLSFASQLSLTADRASPASQLAGVLNAYDPGASMNGASGGWVSVFTGDQELEGKIAGQADVDSRHSGFAGGYGVSNGPWSFGGAAGVSRMEGDVVDRASRYETDLSHAAGYFGYDDGQWAADVTASVFGGEADTRRTVTVGAFSGVALGDTHAEGQAIAASVARRFHFEGDATVALGMIGTLSNASVDGFTETGAGALSLTVAGLERDWQTLNISARASQPYRVNGRTMKVYGGLGVLLTTGDREATGDMRFSGAPTGFGTFTIEGAETPPVAGVTEFGLEVEAADGVSISAGYRGLFSDRLNDNQVGMKLNVRW